MYLLNISNFDYVMMTILFCSVFACAYLFRRKNRSSTEFFMGEQLPLFPVLSGLVGIGLIEFIVIGGYGAYSGLSGVLILIPVFLLIEVLAGYRIHKSLFFTRLLKASYHKQSIIMIIAYVVIILLASGITIAITVSFLKSLLGWEFANSTLSLIAIVAICTLLGGVGGLLYNKTIVNLLVGLILLVVAFISYRNIGNGQLINNLQQVALNNKLPVDYFINFTKSSNLLQQIWLVVIAGLTFIVINPFSFIANGQLAKPKLYVLTKSVKLLLMMLIIILGVYALATPNKEPVIAGKKIVTVQTRLENGELGYIVRAVPGNQVTLQRGIIPVKATDDDSETLDNQTGGNFDYVAANLVMIKKALPYAFVSLFVIVLLFFKAVADNVLFATLAIIQGFYAPKFNKSGEDLENLWAARVFMFALFVIAICIGLVLFKFFSLYYMFALLFIFSTPLALALLITSGKWAFDLIIYIILIALVLLTNLPNVPSLLPLIKFDNLADMVTKLSLLTILLYIVLQLPASYLMNKNER